MPEAPGYGSEWFRDPGVVLRNAFGSDRETYLHLIAGAQHEHYDCHSGSIVQCGKGSLLAKVGSLELAQTALVAHLDGRGAVTSLLYPRLKEEPPPEVTWFDGGAGVRLDAVGGTDFIYLARTERQSAETKHSRQSVEDRTLRFECDVCSIQVRENWVTLSLGSAGKLSFGDIVLESPEPLSRSYPL